MAEIVDIDWQNTPREELKKFLMESLGYDETRANFYISLARGEISGDVISLDENNNEIKAESI